MTGSVCFTNHPVALYFDAIIGLNRRGEMDSLGGLSVFVIFSRIIREFLQSRCIKAMKNESGPMHDAKCVIPEQYPKFLLQARLKEFCRRTETLGTANRLKVQKGGVNRFLRQEPDQLRICRNLVWIKHRTRRNLIHYT
jgi:hypothetical protein